MSDTVKSSHALAVYRRLLVYITPYWRIFVVAVVGMVFYAATDTGFAAVMKPLLDGSFVAKDPGIIALVPVLIIALFLVRGVAGFISSYGMTWVGRRVIRDLREQMFRHLLGLAAPFYDAHPSGQLISKLTFDVEQVAHAATNTITIVIRDTLTILGLLAWMLYLNWVMTLAFILIGPPIVAIVVRVNKRLRRASTNIQASMGDVTHRTEEIIEGHHVVKTFNGQEYEAAQFDKANEYNRKQNMRLMAASAASVHGIQLLAACALAGLIFLVTKESAVTSNSVGEFMSFITAMMLLLAPVKRLTTVNAYIQKGIAASESLFALLDCPPEQDSGTRSVARVRGAIDYRHVFFTYHPDKGRVLEDLNVTIMPNQTVAFVGRSGSGKTSLVSLLPRFYNVDSGTILVDGVEIREFKLADLRRQIAWVGQHVTLFNDTVARNIAYGDMGEVDEDRIVQAAQAAHAMEFIQQLPQGLDTLVGENGVLLSGGQRQRLAIARALYKDAPILILDEATASLDTESERHIQAALERLMQNRTTLVIAHRLSTIEKADNIIVMDKGRVVEQGKHEALLAQQGRYAHLHRMQFEHLEPGDSRPSDGAD